MARTQSKFCLIILYTCMEGTVSQIFHLGLCIILTKLLISKKMKVKNQNSRMVLYFNSFSSK